LSGPDARAIAAKLVQNASRGARRQQLSFDGLSFPAWAYCFVAPRSYTGEDLVELHIPGNPLLAQMLLSRLITLGARNADAGEFTARAFFNGRIDLTEAEGVAASVAAHSDQELRAARRLMAGELARRLRPIMDVVAETLALVEVGIDFSEEDVTVLPPDDARRRITDAITSLDRLVAESARFERLAHEPRVVLVGRPNAGKSTLLNALAGHDRAVVSPIAGTTRDALSAEVALPRGMIHLVDVAGFVGATQASPESADASVAPTGGIARDMEHHAVQAAETADLIVLVQDTTDDRPPPRLAREPDLTVHTKLDLLPAGAALTSLAVSALRGTNLDKLRTALDDLAFGGRHASGAGLALNDRHLHAIAAAREALVRGDPRAGPELLALELRESLDALGEILGTVSPDELLGRIFSTFCIGK
jgi:tRNA modification GTPase